jgi:hypothetical protein
MNVDQRRLNLGLAYASISGERQANSKKSRHISAPRTAETAPCLPLVRAPPE